MANYSPMAIQQTVVTISATSTQLVGSNAARRMLRFMVIGTADVTVAPGTAAAVFGQGMIYQASGLNKQGSSEDFNGQPVTSAFQCIALAAGSQVIVWEGV